jgi:hypothetical protein
MNIVSMSWERSCQLRLRIRIAKYSFVPGVIFLLAKLLVAGLVFRSYSSVLWFSILFTVFCKKNARAS